MKPVRKYLLPEEVERVIVRTSSLPDKLLIQMGLSLGCRISEIVSLRILDLDGRSIKIWDEKKDRPRLCAIDSDTRTLLDRYLAEEYSAPNGVRKEHQTLFYLSPKTVNRRIKDAFARGEVSKEVPWRWHTLRHTYVRRILDQMHDRGIQIICEQTGDTPATILAEYGVPSLEYRLEVADKFRVLPRYKKDTSETAPNQCPKKEGGLRQ